MGKAFKTITLKLHNPSSYKKLVMDEAIMNYTRAFNYLLKRANEEINVLRESYMDDRGQYRTYNIKGWVKGDIDTMLNTFSIEPFKDSIKIDFSGVMAEYLNKQRAEENINFPSSYFIEGETDNDLLDIPNGDAKAGCNENCNALPMQSSNKLRPIYFCRYSERRNFCLLYAPREDRYFVKVYLMNVKSDNRRIANNINSRELIYINDEKNNFIESKRKNCYLILPLAFGKYQEEYLKLALDKPEILKTARLYKKKKDYFISINIEMEKNPCMETQSYMGISRSLVNAVNCTFVDLEGEKSSNLGIAAKDEEAEENELNRIAKQILKGARKHRSQIILENLSKIGDKISWVDRNGKSYNPVLNINKYNKLCYIIENKANEYELPKPIKVSGVGIYYTCPVCLSNSEANRFSQDRIICISCGHTDSLENTGGINLARKLIKYSRDKIKFVLEVTPSGVKISNKKLDFIFYPRDPYNCINELKEELLKLISYYQKKVVEDFENLEFMKKYGIIKKLDNNIDNIEVVQIN